MRGGAHSDPHLSLPEGEWWHAELQRLLRRLPIQDPWVRRAMESVPRHWFVPARWVRQAYEDEPIPLVSGATVSAPHMVAWQCEWLELQRGQRVLELGSGSGYLLALLAELVGPEGKVFGIDIDPHLTEEARRVLNRLSLGSRVQVRTGDARDGWPEESPFDRVVVSFAAPPEEVPAWQRQLAPGGVLLVPLEEAGKTHLVKWRAAANGWVQERGVPCQFVPMRRAGPSLL